jgi:uncharacterized protein (TIGR02301 family)
MKLGFLIAPLAVISMIGGLTGGAFPAASAQSFEDYQSRKTDLVLLSSVFGELHHIRRQCDPRLEGDIWRERMKKLVELEEPQPAVREEMVAAFNKGYRAAQQRFPSCSRNARDHAAARAVRGDAIIVRLTTPLHEAIAEDEVNQNENDAKAPKRLRDF